MENMNYSAPQEAASCGPKKCIFCGSSVKDKYKNRLYCGLECRSQHRRIKTLIVKKCVLCGDWFLSKKNGVVGKAKLCSKKCAAIHMVKTRGPRKWAIRPKRNITHYRGLPVKHFKNVTEKSYYYTKLAKLKNRTRWNGLKRESESIRKFFGCPKGSLSIQTRITNAFRHLGERISSPNGAITRISASEITEIINRIQKGETYAAYE